MALLQCAPASVDAALPDDVLIRRAQQGERAAFAQLYDRYLLPIHAYGYRLLGTREAADDATSQTFLKALAALPTYQPGTDPTAFRRWLFTIAHNVLIDSVRRRRWDVSLDAAVSQPDLTPSPEAQAIAASEQHAVIAALAQLSEDQRQVIALRLTGLSAAETGDVLGKSRQAIHAIQHRAVRRLQAMLASSPRARRGNDDV